MNEKVFYFDNIWKSNIKRAQLVIAVIVFVLFILCLNVPNMSTYIKQNLIYRIETFNDAIKNDTIVVDDNIKVNLPFYNRKNKEKEHPGYCFIGDSDNTRHCVELEKDDNCVSGQIYKTKEICVNPDLRY